MKPTVYMLCGLPGSGKTTYAKGLEQETGALRLTLDEQLFEKFGRESEIDYAERERMTKEYLREVLVAKIHEGKSVILDYGFWKRSARDEYKTLIEKAGAQSQLMYFATRPEDLRIRLHERNATDPINNHIIDEQLLERFIAEFESPHGEGEIIIDDQR